MDKPKFEDLFPKPTLVVMVGLPGSGKSTIAKQLAEDNPNTYIFSSDAYREKLCGDENDQSNNDLVFRTLHKDLRESLLVGKNCIIDATNVTLKDRRRILDNIKDLAIEKIAYFVDTPHDECWERDKARDRSVGFGVIHKFLRRFQFPQRFEGFDKIIMHSQIDKLPWFDLDKSKKFIEMMDVADQYNPHHLYTIGHHCRRLAHQCQDDIMMEAGYFHDFGKLYTKQFDENGVAHYYNHDSVGTYFLATCPEVFNVVTWEEVYEILFYINYHMRAHNDFKSEKAQRKYKALFGEERFNKLMEFGLYDRIASGTYKGEH